MAELIRQFIAEGIRRESAPPATELAFIGAGASGKGDIAERHDDYLDEDL